VLQDSAGKIEFYIQYMDSIASFTKPVKYVKDPAAQVTSYPGR
jgi:hypothetical protein